MRFLQVLLLAALAAAHRPSVFLIRHGEKPLDKDNHHLSDKGKQRAQCLRRVFSEDSHYDITKIMVEKRRKKGKRTRPFDTVAPLAEDLGIEIDDSCEQMDTRCVKKAIKQYRGPGNILICWEHKGLGKIIRKLGVKGKHRYPTKSYNLIWSVHHPYSNIANVASENCPGLDRERPRHGKHPHLLGYTHDDDNYDELEDDDDDDDEHDYLADAEEVDDDADDWLQIELSVAGPQDVDQQAQTAPVSMPEKQEEL
ncbi:hypothetical protein ESCO_003527 [Escovopsis weberi]|uniref:Phosphoglycerate mutase family protein n=1 Tax=Escovopsis weberi TaxID=150374 RepID=A0A0M9VXD7_ESCWE|nr:hypothetical protein ESCO_003527 [Escovopsis weberi]